MSEEFKLEIIKPDSSFLSKEDVIQVVVPSFEGEMGILKDHISIISFLKPGIIKIETKSSKEEYYIEDGIVEFKDNTLSILTSFISAISDLNSAKIEKILKEAEEEAGKTEIDDQKKYLIDQKLNVLRSISTN